MASTGRLSKQAVLDVALAIADAEGLETLTVRRLAQELGVTPMAMYWHFKNKDEVLDGLADRIMGELDVASDPDLPWNEQVEGLLRSFVDVLRAHPCAGPLLSTRNALGEHGLAAWERALDILWRAGFPPDDATDLIRHVVHGAIALVAGGPGRWPAGTEELEERHRRHQAYLESLPPRQFPRLVEAARPLSRPDDLERYYARGMEFLLGGIGVMAGRRSSKTG